MSPARRGIAWTLAFVVAWAIVEALGGLLAPYSPYQVVFTRYVVHLALMALVWGWRDPRSLWRTRRPVYQLARSALMIAMPVSFVRAIEQGVDPRTLLAVFWLSPVLILALSAIVLRERPGAFVWLATLAAGIGPRLLLGAGPRASPGALALPLGMALSFSAYVVMTRSLRSETTRANLFYTALGVVVGLAPFARGFFVPPRPVDLAVMIAIGVLGFVVLYALDRAAEVAPLGPSMPFAYLQLPAFVVLQAVTGHDRPGKRALAAMALLAVVGIVVWLREGSLRALSVERPPPLPSP